MFNVTDPFLLHSDVTVIHRGLLGATALLIIIIGITGNLLVCLAIIKIRRFRNTINILVANLATADILQCLNIISMFITLVKGKWIFGHFLCNANAFFTIGLVAASVFSLVAISINRYVVIYKSASYSRIFSKQRTKVIIIMIWLFSALTAMPPIFGWGTFIFQPRRGFCILDFKSSVSYVTVMSSTILLIPFIFIAGAYSMIFLAIVRNKKRLRQVQPETEIDRNLSRNLSRARALRSQTNEVFSTSIMLFVATFLFVLVYLPTMVFNVMAMIGLGPANIAVDLVFVFVALANHAINPFIYGIINKTYRKSLKIVAKNCCK